MTLSDISIKNPVCAWMLMAALMLFGLISYRFLSVPEFTALLEAGELLEANEVHSNWYGTPKSGVRDAIARGARTLDGRKFRTRAQAGRCHGGFCTTRLMKILAEKTGKKQTGLTKRGSGSEIIIEDRRDG